MGGYCIRSFISDADQISNLSVICWLISLAGSWKIAVRDPGWFCGCRMCFACAYSNSISFSLPAHAELASSGQASDRGAGFYSLQ